MSRRKAPWQPSDYGQQGLHPLGASADGQAPVSPAAVPASCSWVGCWGRVGCSPLHSAPTRAASALSGRLSLVIRVEDAGDVKLCGARVPDPRGWGKPGCPGSHLRSTSTRGCCPRSHHQPLHRSSDGAAGSAAAPPGSCAHPSTGVKPAVRSAAGTEVSPADGCRARPSPLSRALPLSSCCAPLRTRAVFLSSVCANSRVCCGRGAQAAPASSLRAGKAGSAGTSGRPCEIFRWPDIP